MSIAPTTGVDLKSPEYVAFERDARLIWDEIRIAPLSVALQEWVRRYKTLRGCRVCGERDWIVLELHHRDPTTKFKAVSQMVERAFLNDLFAESFKCDVLCANCHRREHYWLQQHALVEAA